MDHLAQVAAAGALLAVHYAYEYRYVILLVLFVLFVLFVGLVGMIASFATGDVEARVPIVPPSSPGG
ncbi:hypothetical protein ACVIIW_005441 [Bradyrhizobium sp. USDA 4449]